METNEYFDKQAAEWDNKHLRIERSQIIADFICKKIPLNKKFEVLDYGVTSVTPTNPDDWILLKNWIIKKYKFTQALGILPPQSIKIFIEEEIGENLPEAEFQKILKKIHL